MKIVSSTQESSTNWREVKVTRTLNSLLGENLGHLLLTDKEVLISPERMRMLVWTSIIRDRAMVFVSCVLSHGSLNFTNIS